MAGAEPAAHVESPAANLAIATSQNGAGEPETSYHRRDSTADLQRVEVGGRLVVSNRRVQIGILVAHGSVRVVAPAADGSALEHRADVIDPSGDVLGRFAELEVVCLRRRVGYRIGVPVTEVTVVVAAHASNVPQLIEEAGEPSGECDLADDATGGDVAGFIRVFVVSDRRDSSRVAESFLAPAADGSIVEERACSPGPEHQVHDAPGGTCIALGAGVEGRRNARALDSL